MGKLVSLGMTRTSAQKVPLRQSPAGGGVVRLTVGMPGRRSESRRPSAEAGPTLSLGTGLHVYQVHR